MKTMIQTVNGMAQAAIDTVSRARRKSVRRRIWKSRKKYTISFLAKASVL